MAAAFVITAAGARVSRSASLTNPGNVILGSNCTVLQSTIDASKFKVTLGARCAIAAGAKLSATAGALAVGEDTAVHAGCTITSAVIGTGCVLEQDVVVGPGAIISDGCIVRAGTVVPPRFTCAPLCVLAGCPAVVVGTVEAQAAAAAPGPAAAAAIAASVPVR